MKTSFEIKVSVNDMYRFLMYHTYHSRQGIFSIIAGVALIVLFAFRHSVINNSWIYLMFGILFLAYFPWTLYTQAAKQVKLGTSFKKPLHYDLDENGITVKQGKESVQIEWKNVYRVRETGSSILIYTNKRNAFIWVKKQMEKAEPDVRRILKKCLSEKICSLKKA